jgi:hypothetical protein
MKYTVRSVLLTIVVMLSLATSVTATQVIFQSLAELGTNSTAVIKGKVAGVRSYWNDSHTKIFTETTITIDETFKGQLGGVVSVVQLGGMVDNIRVTAHGALQWRFDEEVVLFLEPGVDQTYQVAGFSQGKFQIDRDPQTGAVYVTRPSLSGVEIIGAAGDKANSGKMGRIPLQSFMDEALGAGAPNRKN